MDIYLGGILWVVCAAAGGALIAYFVRRIGMAEGRVNNNEAAGHVFTIIAGLHAVLVSFVLISLFDAVGAADDGSYQEANSLVAASWAAESLPEPASTRARELSRSYAEIVARQEWPAMGAGDEVSTLGWERLNELRVVVADAAANDEWQIDRKTEAADQLARVSQAREARLTAAGGGEVGAVLWLVLVVGSVLTVLLSNLFGGTRRTTHILIVTTLSAVIALLLFAIYQLQNPFGGGAQIGPDAFQWAVDRLR
ncbi:bestrophin-like domain [Goodfellowiella coeruleoviolacea]|uniref:bestrophin-like domain n=1 Tax=Goodfellowiella coeruleoviolacea TaxID=334858 RepID=UPI000A92E0C4|nr:DUF4239 domain-containing protein [Goodfellowiella coeruleoviolacea]